MALRHCINEEQATIMYEQTVEADTEEEAIEKANSLGDRVEFDTSGNGDSTTTAELVW